MNRTGLILLQALGGLSILAYPFAALVLVVSQPRDNTLKAFLHLLPLLYPFGWIALWVASWRLRKRGLFFQALVCSVIPIVLSLLLLLYIVSLPHYDRV